MANRGASDAVLNASSQAQANIFHLFEGDFDNGTVRFADTIRDIVWNDNEYLALGYLASFDAIEETADIQATGTNLNLTGVSTEIISLLVNTNLVYKRVRIYRGFFYNDTNKIIPDPIIIFAGRTDGAILSEDIDAGTASVQITANSHWVDFDKVAGRRTNSTEQQKYFPGDLGMDFIADLVNKDVTWK